MNTAILTDEIKLPQQEAIGMQLASIRQQKGYTIEYVANKLHLRVRIIELIEQSQFDLLPESVFIKGYLRAYAKLLGVSPEPFLAIFNQHYSVEKKVDRALWQSKRESYKAEHFIRWFTITFAVGAIIAISMWWHNNREQLHFSKTVSEQSAAEETSSSKHIAVKEIKLTDIAALDNLINPAPQMSAAEAHNE
ncbi:MAG: DNA-binding protein [Legionella sp.]|nr:MAG: DNA-binding protein [Legionella sp.]PJD98973.1 MAG: DNA-binding protein [Legionella sp.]